MQTSRSSEKLFQDLKIKGMRIQQYVPQNPITDARWIVYTRILRVSRKLGKVTTALLNKKKKKIGDKEARGQENGAVTSSERDCFAEFYTRASTRRNSEIHIA